MKGLKEMFKVGDRVVITKEAENFLDWHPEYKNKVFIVTSNCKNNHYEIRNEIGRCYAYVNETKGIYHIKKVSILLSEFLKSL